MNARHRATHPVAGGAAWDNKGGTGHRANGDPLLDRIDLVYEGSGPVHIVPKADSTASTPPDVARMARADGCPVCVTNYTLPRITRPNYEGAGFLAYYSCEDCGHDWFTSWED